MTSTGAWKFEVTSVDEVPLTRGGGANSLAIDWNAMVTRYETTGKPSHIFIPKAYWIKDRLLHDDDKAEGIASSRIKAAFAGYRSGIEKQRKTLVPWGVAVGVNKGDDGGWDGHHVYIQPQDLDVRKEAIQRAKNMQAKAKKPAKKAAVKKRSAA